MNIIEETSPIRLLLVDDNEHDRIAFRRSLEKAKIAYNIIEFSHAEDALDYIHSNPSSIELLVSDQKLPGMSGMELCQRLLREGIEIPLVIITGAGTENLAVKALKAGVSDYIIKDSAGRYLQLLPLVLLDVAKNHREYLLRKRMEAQLEESEKKYRSLYEASRDGFVRIDLKGNIQEFNSSFTEMLCFSSQELLNKKIHDLSPAVKRPLEEKLMQSQDFLGRGYSGYYEKEFIKKDGYPLYTELRYYLLRNDNGRPEGMWSFVRDITREKEIKQELKDRNVLIEEILDKSPIGIAVHSVEKGNIEYLNTTFRKIFEIGECKPHTLPDIFKNTLFAGQQADEIKSVILSPMRHLTSLPKYWHEVQLTTSKQKEKIINISCIPLANNNLMLCSLQDITGIKLLHNRVIRSERLAATGQLAVSIAHAINSPLQAITLMLSELSAMHDRDSDLGEGLQLLREAYSNIKSTVSRLLNLNRPGKAEKQPVHINAIIRETAALLESHLKKNKISIRLHLSIRIPPILGSPQELAQVFLNLTNNAVEAISGLSKLEPRYRSRMNTSGEITIRSRIAKNQAIITVKDNGPGISAQDLDNIFDPFYTSKKKMGIGIGLAACYTIIDDHGGRITAKNLPEGGALFTIQLPLDKDITTGV